MIAQRWLACLLVAAFTASCVGEHPPEPQDNANAQTRQPVIYGEDNRLDVYAHPDEALQELTRRSIVALVPLDQLDESDPENIQITPNGFLGENQDLCEDQRFRDHPRVSRCSATLIDDDLVLTAGHCIGSQSQCEDRAYVFDVHYAAEGQFETITADEVYRCQRLVQTVTGGDLDHAIIQLDRPVTGDHGPAPVKLTDEPMAVGAAVTLIGFPNQIPAKIADGGAVINPREGSLDYFEATVDAFGGNSGSGVFDENGVYVGTLVRGERDYTDRDDCTVVNVLDDARTLEEGAEDITYVARAIERLCTQGFDSERLCGGDAREWCFTCDLDEDCQEGWTCQQWPDAPDVSFCAAPCGSDDDCREDHACDVEAGRCQPRRERRCDDGDVVEFDVCGVGRALAPVETCGDAQFCRSGTCIDRGPGDTCATAEIIEPVDQTIQGSVAGNYSNTRRGTCAGNGPERIYTFEVTEATTLTATMTGFDTVLHLRSDCTDQDTQIACIDDSEPPGERGSQIEVDLTPGTWSLVADAFNFNFDNDGEYELTLDFGPSCPTDCEDGASRCEGAATVACTIDDQGCPVELAPVPCDDGQICNAGQCTEPGDGDTCENPTVIEPVNQIIEGSLFPAYTNNHRGSCGGEGQERVLAFELAVPTRFQAILGGYDTVMHLREGCDGTGELVCNDDIERGNNLGSGILTRLEPGDYRLFVDSFAETTEAYSLVLSFEPLCEDECQEGDAVCVPEGVQRCELIGGCLLWNTPETCGDDELCRGGACVTACVDECETAGERVCVSDKDYQLCGVGPDGCLVLGGAQSCPQDLVCDSGECAQMEMPEPEPTPEPVTPPVTSTPKDDGCGCAVPTRPAQTPWPLIGLALIGFAAVMRR